MNENGQKSLKANIIFSFVTQIIIYVSPLIVAPYVSRVLGPEGVGEYSHAYSFMFYFSSAIIFGFSAYGINVIAANRDDKQRYSAHFWMIVLERFVFFIIFGSIYLVVLFFDGFGGQVECRIGLSLGLVLLANVLDITFLFQGLEEFNIVSYIHVFSNFCFVLFVFLFVKTADDILIYAIIKSSINLMLAFFLWIISIRKIEKPSIEKKDFWPTLCCSAKFFLPSLLMSIGPQIDQSLIGINCSKIEVGYYQQAYKMPSIISSMTYAISPVMLSRVAFLYKEGKIEEVKQKISLSICLALCVSLPCCIGLYLIARFFVPLYFGSEYLPSIPILYLLLPLCILSPISSILINSIYYPTKKTKKLTIYLVVAIFGNAIVTFLLTRFSPLGAKGAAFGTIGAELFLLGSMIIDCKSDIYWGKICKDIWKIIVGLVGIVAVVLPLSLFSNLQRIYLLIISVASGGIIYFVILLCLKENLVMLLFNKIRRKLNAIK